MKLCHKCRTQFADRFRFCPIDGTSLEIGSVDSIVKPAAARQELQATDEIAGATELDDLMLLQLSDLLKRGEVPPVPVRLYPQLLEGFMEIVRHKEKRSNEKMRDETYRSRVLTFCHAFAFLLATCVIALTVVLVVLGQINLPAEVIYVLLGLLGGRIGKGAVWLRTISPAFPNESERAPDYRLPGYESARLFAVARQPQVV
jgi:hypothetical protein